MTDNCKDLGIHISPDFLNTRNDWLRPTVLCGSYTEPSVGISLLFTKVSCMFLLFSLIPTTPPQFGDPISSGMLSLSKEYKINTCQ